MAVRYDKKFLNEINRVVRNYNAKINRLDKGLTEYILPNKTNLTEIKNTYTNRTDIRRYLKDLQAFTKRGAEQNVSESIDIPKYLFNQIKTKTRRFNYNINRQLKLYETTNVKNIGKKQKQSLASYYDLEYKNLKAKKDILNKPLSKLTGRELLELNVKLSANTKTDRNQIFKENFIEMLASNYRTYGIETGDVKKLQQKIDTLSPEEFYKFSRTETLIRNILDYYNKIGSEDFNVFYENNLTTVQSDFDDLYNNIDTILEDYA